MTNITPIVGASVHIPKELLTHADMDQIRSDLTFRVGGKSKYGFGAEVHTLMTYDDSGDWMIVPRAYGVSLMRNVRTLAGVDPVDTRSAGLPVQFDFNEKLQAERPTMKAIQDRLVEQTVRKLKGGISGGVLCAPCGTGKTVMGCKVTSEIGTTTLILAHKEFLVEQWCDRIAQWLQMNRDEIGVVQQNRCEYDGRRIVVAMLQSIVERDYPSELYSWPGLVIADEVHRHGADLWHKAALRFMSKYRLGLTATPTRKDGMWDIVRNNFGEILAQDDGEAMKPTVYIVRYVPGYNIRQYAWVQPSAVGYYRVKKVYLGKFITLLTKDPDRNKMLVDILMKGYKQGRKNLLLTDRREHITLLKKMIAERDASATVGRYVGGMSAKARAISEGCQIILGTFQMAQEALDIPSLDAGILGTPHSDVEQASGRICRMRDGKKQPVLVDIFDDEEYIGRPFFDKRERFYLSRGWPIRYIK